MHTAVAVVASASCVGARRVRILPVDRRDAADGEPHRRHLVAEQAAEVAGAKVGSAEGDA
jgi:hypothetical protein